MIGLAIFGTAVTVASLIYAIKTNDEKKKREAQVKETLIGLAGNVVRIQTNLLWADVHFGAIRDIALKGNDMNNIKDIITRAHVGARDAVAAERMLGNLLNQIITIQRSLFGTEEIKHVCEGNKLNPTGINLEKYKEEKK